ncbi:hypothetical protein EGW08_017298 [Elysia chlorotica]|uniref:Uncharacterized protein n=1 Tax=Elysia chlorotica TaxID=188477 RepID=A0A3S1B4P9_ELYCH|nr:hypothetical protein EGW08_017298 [Elysia chlorotica]
MSAVVLCSFNFAAVFYPHVFYRREMLVPAAVATVASWVVGVSVTVLAVNPDFPADIACTPIPLMPRYGVMTLASTCLLCTIIVVAINIKLVLYFRKFRIHSSLAPNQTTNRSPGDGQDGRLSLEVRSEGEASIEHRRMETRNIFVVSLDEQTIPSSSGFTSQKLNLKPCGVRQTASFSGSHYQSSRVADVSKLQVPTRSEKPKSNSPAQLEHELRDYLIVAYFVKCFGVVDKA